MNFTSKVDIVLIDDNVDALEIMSMLLRMHDCTVEEFIHPQIAIDAIGLLRPKIIITDIKMPDLNGYDVLQAAKSVDKSYDPYVICISGYNDLNFDRPDDALKFDFEFKKPMNNDLLIKMLQLLQ